MTTKTPSADQIRSKLEEYLKELPEVLNEYDLDGFMILLNLNKNDKLSYYAAVNGSPLSLIETMTDAFKQAGHEIDLMNCPGNGTLH